MRVGPDVWCPGGPTHLSMLNNTLQIAGAVFIDVSNSGSGNRPGLAPGRRSLQKKLDPPQLNGCIKADRRKHYFVLAENGLSDACYFVRLQLIYF